MLEKIKAFLEGNEEAMAVYNEAEKSVSELTTKINLLEVDSRKAFQTRDELKSKINAIKTKLGVEDITDEALDGILKGKKGDDTELNNLKSLLQKAESDKMEIENGYKQKLSDFALKAELTKTGLAQKAINPAMYSVLEQVALQGAVYEDGVVKFVNADGSTQYHNGKALTLSDRVEQLNGTPEYAPLFVPQGKGGTGGKGGGESVLDFGKMSATEMMKAGRK